jgi:hypothetical protein
MFRTILAKVSQLVHALRQRLRTSVTSPPPAPLTPAEHRMQRRLEKSRHRTRAARTKGRKVVQR